MATRSKSSGDRAVLYLRTSTSEQHTANQRPVLEQIAQARGLTIVHVYEEQVGATKVRPQHDAMMRAAHRGEFGIILTAAIDRLGRSMIENLNCILRLDQRGVRVISAREPWLEMEGPVRNLLVAVFSWVAGEELAQIRSRTIAGLERARRAGKKLGRPRAHVEVAYVEQLRRQGMSMPAIARKVGVSRATLFRLVGVSNTGSSNRGSK